MDSFGGRVRMLWLFIAARRSALLFQTAVTDFMGVRLAQAIPVGFGGALAAYWLAYLRGTGPSVFGDTVRYLDVGAGWALLLRFDLHQGAFLPVLLFQAVGDLGGVFLVNSFVWIVSWTILSAAITRRCDLRSAVVVNLAILLVATTSQVVGWLGAVLTESLTTSAAVIVVAAAITDDAQPTPTGRFSRMTVGASGLLFVTRPFLLLALAPLVVLVVHRRRVFRNPRGVAGVAIAAGLVMAMVLIGGRQPYADGLTFKGWYALTRAVHWSQDRALSALTSAPLLSCAPVNAAITSSVARGYGLGLVPEFGDALRACPEQVAWLNSSAPGAARLFLAAPMQTLEALATSAAWIANPAVYPSLLLGRGSWGQGAVHRLLTPWETGPYLLVLFAVLMCVCVRGPSRLAALGAVLLAGVVCVGVVAIFTDGIEQGRHASVFNVLSLVAMALALDGTRQPPTSRS